MVDRAMSRTGLFDLGDTHFQPTLESWCADLDSAPLTEGGQQQLARQAERNLHTRLGIIDVIKRNPEIHEVKLPRIVRIMGFPRSGTTLLHNLMGRQVDARSLLRWELTAPLPPPEAATHSTDPRIGSTQRVVETLRGSELERMHWVEAQDPEECTWGFFDLSGLMGRSCVNLMSNWTKAIFPGHPRRQTYQEYRSLVQLLLWQNPLPPGGVLVLKCPTDVDQAATFLDTFPEAGLVLCHRDPYRTLTSTCHLQAAAQEAWTDGTQEPDRDDHNMSLQTQVLFAEAMVAVSASHPDRVANVHYPDLMSDPAGAVVGAYAELDVDPGAELASGVRDFIDRQRAGGRATPPDRYGSYGYDRTSVWDNRAMSRYVHHFGITPEAVRITQTEG